MDEVFPKGTTIFFIAGVVLLASAAGLALTLPEYFHPVPLWMRLPVLVMGAVGTIVLFLVGYGVVLGIGDSLRNRTKK